MSACGKVRLVVQGLKLDITPSSKFSHSVRGGQVLTRGASLSTFSVFVPCPYTIQPQFDKHMVPDHIICRCPPLVVHRNPSTAIYIKRVVGRKERQPICVSPSWPSSPPSGNSRHEAHNTADHYSLCLRAPPPGARFISTSTLPAQPIFIFCCRMSPHDVLAGP